MKSFLFFCLVKYFIYISGNEVFEQMDFMNEENVLKNVNIKKKTAEIMHPESKYMKTINDKIQEMMHPKSKYMEEINRRLELLG